MTGQDLKNSILQLAIQGKLVPQDANDEPASVLLERIKAEKQKLINEKKIKKEKPLPEITDEEKPFEIPETWEWVRIPEIGVSQLGKTKNPNQTKGISQKYLCSINVYWNKIDLANVKEMLFDKDEIDKYQVKKGDLLICEGGDCGRSAIWNLDDNICYQNALHRVRFYCGINPFYVYNCLLAYYNNGTLNDYIKGETIKHLVKGKLDIILFPLPPLAEQHRIVAKIEELMPLVEEYDKAQKELDALNAKLPEALKKSILQEAIQGKLVPQDPNDEPASVLLQRIRKEKEQLIKDGKLKKKDLVTTPITDEEKPFEIPETWEWVRLSDVVKVNPKNDVPDSTLAAFIPMERIDATYLSSFTYLERKWGDIKSGFTHFADGDVAFAKITPCFQNRKSMILKGLPNGVGAGTTELKVLRPYAETIDREYLLFFLESSYFVEEAIFKGTANQQRIISGYMENKLFPLPPLAEQHRIVSKIEDLFAQIEPLAKALSTPM